MIPKIGLVLIFLNRFKKARITRKAAEHALSNVEGTLRFAKFFKKRCDHFKIMRFVLRGKLIYFIALSLRLSVFA